MLTVVRSFISKDFLPIFTIVNLFVCTYFFSVLFGSTCSVKPFTSKTEPCFTSVIDCNSGVLFSKYVSMLTGYLPRKWATLDVLGMGDRFQVFRVHTRSDSAQVIYFQPFNLLTIEQARQPMWSDYFTTVRNSSCGIPFFVEFVPEPTACFSNSDSTGVQIEDRDFLFSHDTSVASTEVGFEGNPFRNNRLVGWGATPVPIPQKHYTRRGNLV